MNVVRPAQVPPKAWEQVTREMEARVMTEFQEADARLGAMHGYPPLDSRAAMNAVLVQEEQVGALQRIAAIEAKLDALILALKAGAIGRWQ